MAIEITSEEAKPADEVEFTVGDSVALKGDTAQGCPMTVLDLTYGGQAIVTWRVCGDFKLMVVPLNALIHVAKKDQ